MDLPISIPACTQYILRRLSRRYLSYWHNHLGFPGQTNCTERGPDCFSPGLNISCRTETSAYTQLRLDENGDGNIGWVQYDMHGIQFAMKFSVGPKRR